MTEYEKLQRCLAAVRAKTDFVPKLAIVLGSGLGDYGDRVESPIAVSYSDIPDLPQSTAPGHKGQFIFGYIKGVPVVVMQGRVHMYEGYTPEQAVLPIRLMGLLGAKALFLTNAAGGANPDFVPGDLMLITDQISCFVPSPLLGKNIDELGPRFPDMTKIYDEQLSELIRRCASECFVLLREGVYVQLRGPQYESPAEIRMLRAAGADAVGMSTAVEAIAANHMGMRVCGVSCITNLAAGMSGRPLNGQEVIDAGKRVAEQFSVLVTCCVAAMGETL